MPAYVTTDYVDDLDNTDIDPKNVDTVDFSYRGNTYTLVLTKQHGSQFDKDIAPWIKAAEKAQAQVARAAKAKPAARTQKSTGARKTATPAKNTAARKAAPPRKAAASKTTVNTNERSRAKAIRAWAANNGHKVSERGRISASVVEAFDAAQ
ncbi:Lsr2 family protein [Mycobacterium avium subsp. hominissuis]|jgi:Lsr2.|uniref:Lsr2 family protein n=1 Tax=Mycobacterium avium TaxID=1764 RepID=A0A2A2ZN09_MYCAV|nr:MULTISPECIES: Lsr2 family protein [Mycobacteriaceae]MDO2384336.1 Lsr2 family protein [Mycobacterium avium subsp. hominissuis]MDO2395292.1 Lsr2 family protein [Mycobacterium avium subsp. hominissuis]PBA27917.1 Lsr2 family protein [Mycobacterium avium]RUP32504.1 MAG: Lsr2 family protein [Mycolicibacterium sp.]